MITVSDMCAFEHEGGCKFMYASNNSMEIHDANTILQFMSLTCLYTSAIYAGGIGEEFVESKG